MDNSKISKFKNKIGTKPIIILIMILLFLIPINLIKSIIDDRSYYQSDAIDSILQPKGGEPNLQGIVLAIPYTKVIEIIDEDKNVTYKENTYYIISTPEEVNINSQINPEYLNRGIFEVPVFNSSFTIKGSFSKLDYSHTEIDNKNIQWDKAQILLGVLNKKTILESPEFFVNGKKLDISLTEASNCSPFSNTIFFDLPEKFVNKDIEFDINLKIQGGNKLKITPIARNTEIGITSNWTTPSFSGGWLPTERNIDESGFSAKWNIAGLSTIFPKIWLTENEIYKNKYPEQIVVAFMTPVDNYKKTERSIKYALLFLLIPFITIFIFEIFTNIRIHPIQYCLIGLADVIFYLLLLSISEHLSFSATYWIASSGVSLLMLFYASTIFKVIKWGLAFACTQFVSYIFLFGTLQAEDYALLIGSLGLFFVLCLLMILTRKIDWYSDFLDYEKKNNIENNNIE